MPHTAHAQILMSTDFIASGFTIMFTAAVHIIQWRVTVEFLHVLNRINHTLAFQDQLQQPYADMCALLLSVNTQHSTAMYHGRIDLPRKRLC